MEQLQPYQIQLVDADRLPYIMRVAERIIHFGWKVTITPYMDKHTVGLILWCKDIHEYVAITNQLKREVSDYDTYE